MFVKCNHCDTVYKIDNSQAGSKTKCRCGKIIDIPIIKDVIPIEPVYQVVNHKRIAEDYQKKQSAKNSFVEKVEKITNSELYQSILGVLKPLAKIGGVIIMANAAAKGNIMITKIMED